MRFEEQVQRELILAFPDYQPNPHIVYWTAKGPRNAFPDGLLTLNDRTVIVEIKRQHMPEAWWQLRRHYQLVLEQYRIQPVQVLEIVKSFDSQMPFPEEFDLITPGELTSFLERDPQRFGVMKWKPQSCPG